MGIVKSTVGNIYTYDEIINLENKAEYEAICESYAHGLVSEHYYKIINKKLKWYGYGNSRFLSVPKDTIKMLKADKRKGLKLFRRLRDHD